MAPRMPSGRAWRLTTSAVAVIATLAAGRLLAQTLPTSQAGTRPFVTTAQIGERVPLRDGSVVVTGVRGAPTLSQWQQTYTTPGLYVMVDITFTPADEITTLQWAQFRATNGTLWGGSPSNRHPDTCSGAIPGLPLTCSVAVDVPVDRLAGLHVVLGPDASGEDFDAVADVDLAITADLIRQWQSATDPVAPQPKTLDGVSVQ